MPNTQDSLIHQIPLYISKSSIYNGEMRWSAVNSDTDWDLYGERMSLELYKGMISKIKSNVPPPEPFAELVTSEYWRGGMPYLSIAHYSDGNGKAVPGDVRELFIDGNQLKAKGTLHDSPLGKAVWKSLKADELNYKNNLDTDRIRISIAFLDLAHRHGEDGAIFRRKSFEDLCPECLKGVGEKIYLDGYLVHLALTRVPVNPRTIMEAEDVMAKKAKPETRFEDAVAVLGGDEELAKSQVVQPTLETRSDVLVEMSEPEVVEEPKVETPEVGEPSQGEEVFSVTKSELQSIVQSLVQQSMDEKKKDKSKEEDEDEEEMPKKSATVSKSALELSVDKLYNVVNGVISKAGTAEDKLQEVQPVLDEVGQAIFNMVKSSVGETPHAPAQASDAVLEMLQAMKSQIETIGTEVATLKAQSTNVPAQATRVPAPRSITPSVVKSVVPDASQENPNSVKNIVRRSVGL